MAPATQWVKWFCTWSRCPIDKQRCLDHIENLHPNGATLQRYIVAAEQHEDGAQHLHGYFEFDRPIKFEHVNPSFDIGEYHGNYKHVRKPVECRAYCRKDGDFLTNFTEADIEALLADDPRERKRKRNEKLLGTPIEELVANGDILVTDVERVVRNRYAYAQATMKPLTADQCKGIWIVGDSGTGKSHWARTRFPTAYVKPGQNKWWDGYNWQRHVIIEDLDHEGRYIGYHLKIWADRWGCSAEVKGSSVPLVHSLLIITSQYEPEEIWGDARPDGKRGDNKLVDAIRRRFVFFHMFKKDGWSKFRPCIRHEIDRQDWGFDQRHEKVQLQHYQHML